jgi:hypothetical protein
MRAKLWILIGFVAFSAACGGSSKQEAASVETAMSMEDETAALHRENPVGSYGRALAVKETMTIGGVLQNCDALAGKPVRVAGTVHEVCPARGCWLDMTDDSGEKLRIKVTDGAIVFPLSAVGQPVVAEGVLTRIELNHEQAVGYLQHLADEKGEAFDPASVGPDPLVIWQVTGQGAVIGK